MDEKYIPQIQEAAVPAEGAWSEVDGYHLLILSIPEWSDLMEEDGADARYAWMYDRAENAYLISFRLSNGIERAIAFPQTHAGLFLQDQRANQPFSIMITQSELQKANDQDEFFILPQVRLIRHPKAGW